MPAGEAGEARGVEEEAASGLVSGMVVVSRLGGERETGSDEEGPSACCVQQSRSAVLQSYQSVRSARPPIRKS